MAGREVVQVTIPNGTSVSNAMSAGAHRIVGIVMPAAWTAGSVTFEAPLLDGTTFKQVFDNAGAAIAAASPPTAGGVVMLPMSSQISCLGPFRVRSGTTASAVNQGADRTLGIILDIVTPSD